MSIQGLNNNQKMEIVYICKEHKNRKKKLECTSARVDATFMTEHRKVMAVETAIEEIEPCLRKAIWDNVAHRIAYEYLAAPICRQGFYKIRSQFLHTIYRLIS